MSYLIASCSGKKMYNPIQIPYMLNHEFNKHVRYVEKKYPLFERFFICFWEMTSLPNTDECVDNIIIPDGCIDLIVDYKNKRIGYAGMSKTSFHFKISPNSQYLGVRMKPGAFNQLTQVSAYQVMDKFIPINDIDHDFDLKNFFSLPILQIKSLLKKYLFELIKLKEPSYFMLLFDQIYSTSPFMSTTEIYQKLNYSPRQCQRLFMRHFGISPKMVLSVIRFQLALKQLCSSEQKHNNIEGYYDQSHTIHDIKKNIGITPIELIRRYKN